MKKILIFLFLGFQAFFLFSQESSKQLLVADSNWGKETITFPLGFARSIDYEGVEEIRFSPGWSKQDSLGFWSYAFLWNVKATKAATAIEIEKDLEAYFDGLMAPGDQDESLNALPSTVLVIPISDSKNTRFIAKVRTFDKFRAKKMMTLNARIEVSYCENNEKMNILFQFSPKDFDSEIWKKLASVLLHPDACED